MTSYAPVATPQRSTFPRLQRLLHYYSFSLATIMRDWAFLTFVIAMPVAMYLFFSTIYGDIADSTVAATMMVTMATYGGLGAAMNAGASIQAERSSGWFRSLRLTPLSTGEFIGAKAATAATVMVPALLTVFLAGAVKGVDLDLATWAAMLGLLMAALLPMVVLGLVIGLWFAPQSASAVTTIAMLSLSMLGGLWIPLDSMPEAMQHLGRALPSYWAARIGGWPLAGGDFPAAGVFVIVAWTGALLALGAWGFTRAVRTARR